MQDEKEISVGCSAKPGRPRRGTELERSRALIAAATRVFLRDGYALASIDKVAVEAGASTRTIYERFRNKEDLLAAVISRLVDSDLAIVFAPEELAPLPPPQGLALLGETLLRRMAEPAPAALYRIIAREAPRFPELVEKMRTCASLRFEHALADYFRRLVESGALEIADPDHAAGLFLHMMAGELRERVLFGDAELLAAFDPVRHAARAVDLFLRGVLPRAVAPGAAAPGAPAPAAEACP